MLPEEFLRHAPRLVEIQNQLQTEFGHPLDQPAQIGDAAFAILRIAAGAKPGHQSVQHRLQPDRIHAGSGVIGQNLLRVCA